MKWLLKVLVFILLGVGFALLAIEDTGYVLIARSPWLIEMSLTLFALLVVAGFLVLYLLIRFIVNSWGIGHRIGEWRQQRRHRQARQSLNRGLLELAQRNWKKAEKLLLKHADDSESPLLNYLAAASAAQEQGEDQRRDDYLSRAHDAMPGSDVAVALTQADLQLRHGQQEQALATLTHLQAIAPRHPHVLKMLMRLYFELQEWDKLHELLPALRKQKLASDDELLELETAVYGHLLEGAVRLEEFHAAWAKLPKPLRVNSALAAQYAAGLMQHGADNEAIEVIRRSLQKDWQPSLVTLYARAHGSDANRQLAWAEQQQAEHRDDPVLLAALAQLAVRNELWGKARAWFEASIGLAPRASTYRALGELLEQLDEHAEAAKCYREGLMLVGQ